MVLDEYLQLFAEVGKVAAANGHLSREEVEQVLDQISDGLPPLPSLPADFSRKDLYTDHD
jgi:hypothetical protein